MALLGRKRPLVEERDKVISARLLEFLLQRERECRIKMSCVEAKKPHAVLVPFPAQGHITPFMQLAKLLHSRGFHITFVNTEHNQRRLIRNKGPDSVKGLPDFRFEAIPDGLPLLDRDVTQEIPAVCESTQKHSLGPLLELLGRLNSSPDEVPRVTCIILDGAMGFAVKAAESLGVPAVVFWTLSACGFLGYFHYRELRRKGIFPFKDENFISNGTLDTPLDWISGMSNIRLRDLPSFIRTTDPDTFMVSFMASETINSLKASAVIFNTFEELEHEALEAIAAMSPNVYAIGPLQLLERHMPETNCKSYRSNLWKEDSNCLEWLDEREPSSVVYVNYGSVTVMAEEQLKEFASGLANSKHPFLWVVRPDVVKGQSSSWLQEYIEGVKDSGLVVSWCPQDLVLQHPSIGVFLTHCGWNSTLETICGGVPVICWPFFAEQQTNCRYACTTWGIGMEVNEDVKHDEVEALVREMMECNNGKQRRLKALGWKKKAEAATDIGGSSYNNLVRLIKEVLAGDV